MILPDDTPTSVQKAFLQLGGALAEHGFLLVPTNVRETSSLVQLTFLGVYPANSPLFEVMPRPGHRVLIAACSNHGFSYQRSRRWQIRAILAPAEIQVWTEDHRWRYDLTRLWTWLGFTVDAAMTTVSEFVQRS